MPEITPIRENQTYTSIRAEDLQSPDEMLENMQRVLTDVDAGQRIADQIDHRIINQIIVEGECQAHLTVFPQGYTTVDPATVPEPPEDLPHPIRVNLDWTNTGIINNRVYDVSATMSRYSVRLDLFADGREPQMLMEIMND